MNPIHNYEAFSAWEKSKKIKQERKSLIFGIDFDGTCVTHEFPNIGKDIGAVPVLRDIVAAGHKLILFTMRSNMQKGMVNEPGLQPTFGSHLDAAVNWFKENEILLFGINENPTQKEWTSSPKPYCHIYIDDAALSAPLKFDWVLSDSPFINWARVRFILEEKQIIDPPMKTNLQQWRIEHGLHLAVSDKSAIEEIISSCPNCPLLHKCKWSAFSKERSKKRISECYDDLILWARQEYNGAIDKNKEEIADLIKERNNFSK